MKKVKLLVADGQRLFADALAITLAAFPGFDVIDERVDTKSLGIFQATVLLPVSLRSLWPPSCLVCQEDVVGLLGAAGCYAA